MDVEINPSTHTILRARDEYALIAYLSDDDDDDKRIFHVVDVLAIAVPHDGSTEWYYVADQGWMSYESNPGVLAFGPLHRIQPEIRRHYDDCPRELRPRMWYLEDWLTDQYLPAFVHG